MSNDLFDAGDHDQLDDTKDFLAEYVGEGKKFKDEKELARGKYESDRFIVKLQSELAEMREELTKGQRLQDLIDKLSKLEKPAEGLDNQHMNDGQKAPELDIEKLVEQKLEQKQAQAKAEANLASVKKALLDKFGASYPEKLTQQAQALGLSQDDVVALAQRSPAAVLKMVGVDDKPAQGGLFTPPTGHQTGGGFTPGTSDRTEAWYSNLKKTNPGEYWSAKTQSQMHKDAIRLQEKFFDK